MTLTQMHAAIVTWLRTPPTTEFQRGYLGALLNIYSAQGGPLTDDAYAATLLLREKHNA